MLGRQGESIQVRKVRQVSLPNTSFILFLTCSDSDYRLLLLHPQIFCFQLPVVKLFEAVCIMHPVSSSFHPTTLFCKR